MSGHNFTQNKVYFPDIMLFSNSFTLLVLTHLTKENTSDIVLGASIESYILTRES